MLRRRKGCKLNGTDGKLMPDLSIKVGFRGPLLAKNEKEKTARIIDSCGFYACDTLLKSIRRASFFEIDPCFSIGG